MSSSAELHTQPDASCIERLTIQLTDYTPRQSYQVRQERFLSDTVRVGQNDGALMGEKDMIWRHRKQRLVHWRRYLELWRIDLKILSCLYHSFP
jgi:hypothetical protein